MRPGVSHLRFCVVDIPMGVSGRGLRNIKASGITGGSRQGLIGSQSLSHTLKPGLLPSALNCQIGKYLPHLSQVAKATLSLY